MKPKERLTERVEINFTVQEKKKLDELLNKHPNITRTQFIKDRIFQHREREKFRVNILDFIFLSRMANHIKCLLDDAQRGQDLVPHANDLMAMIDEKLNHNRSI